MNTYQQAKAQALHLTGNGQIDITPLLHTYTIQFNATQEEPDHWYIESTVMVRLAHPQNYLLKA